MFAKSTDRAAVIGKLINTFENLTVLWLTDSGMEIAVRPFISPVKGSVNMDKTV